MLPITFPPPTELLRDLPDDMPIEFGVAAWQTGLRDGLNDSPHFELPRFTELQPLYDRGYAAGDLSRQISDVLESGPGGEGARNREEAVPAQWAHNALHRFVKVGNRFVESNALQVALGILIGFLVFVVANGMMPWH